MESSHKKKLNVHEEEEMDRLSDLPDCLLLHILSFLPETKCSVRTCVLSKRWKCLWASLPDLVICGRDRIPLFKKFVHLVLSGRNHNIPVRKFFLSYPGRDKSLITRIIDYAISHNVQHFSISLLKTTSLRILFPLFDSSCSLKTLKLEYFHDQLVLLGDINIPTLTTLHVSDWNCYPVKPIDSLDPFVGLVNLKSLRIESCRTTVDVFKISGPQLHSLILCRSSLGKYKVEIIAPKLHSFEFIETYITEFSNLNFPLLETADVDVNDAYSKRPEKSHLDLIKMFRGLSHAQTLYISSRTIEVLTKFPGWLEDQVSPFDRLKNLIVRSGCNPLISIPDNVMNYFVQGTIFSPILSSKITEGKLCDSKLLIFDRLIERSEQNQW